MVLGLLHSPHCGRPSPPFLFGHIKVLGSEMMCYIVGLANLYARPLWLRGTSDLPGQICYAPSL